MKTRPRTPYKCGQCGYTSLKIVDLHQHLLDHSGSVGYFYDIGTNIAFPKWKYGDSLVKLNVYTQTEEQLSSDHPEITAEVSTIVKTEMFDAGIDLQNDFEELHPSDHPEIKDEDSNIVKTEIHVVEMDTDEFEITLQEDISDVGLEFYEQNPAFNGTGNSEVHCISEHDYSKPFMNVPSFEFKTKQIKKTRSTNKKKPKKRNCGTQQKRSQGKQNKMRTVKMSQTDNGSQSNASLQFKGANDEDQFALEYMTTLDHFNVAGINKNGNRLPVITYEKSSDYDLHKVELTKMKTNKHKCTACSFSCPTKYQLMVHMSKDCEKNYIICDICGIVVTNKRDLSDHKKSCYRKRHKCNICDAAFKRPNKLRVHLLLHTGELPMVCDQCARAFRTQSQLARHHKRMHTKERNYQCDHCEKSFALKYSLVKHVRTHNNVLLYSCQFCERKFSTSWNMKVHTRQHTGNKPYKCSKCGKSFTQNVSRKTHQAKCLFIPGVTDNT